MIRNCVFIFTNEIWFYIIFRRITKTKKIDVLNDRNKFINFKVSNSLSQKKEKKMGMTMYLNSSLADVHCDVFFNMFYGSLPETGDVTIVDATAEIFEIFLQFIYMNDIKLTIENMDEVLCLAKKYNVIECQRKCVDFLPNVLTFENAISILSLAVLYDQESLQKL